jgi:hypothetical protein
MKIRTTSVALRSYITFAFLTFIWFFAFLLSSPLFLFNKIESQLIDLDVEAVNGLYNDTDASESSNEANSSLNADAIGEHHSNIDEIDLAFLNGKRTIYDVYHCVENWPFNHSRLFYSYSSLLIQYILPILIVGVAYGSISLKLKKQRSKLKNHSQLAALGRKELKVANKNTACANKNEMGQQELESNSLDVNNAYNNRNLSNNQNTNDSSLQNNSKRNAANSQEKRRHRKMNILLAFIAIIFAASWLPLNILNILSDSNVTLIKPNHTFYVINAICILFAMSSAVSNPFLYGFLNENFKREYVKFFRKLINKISMFFCHSRQRTQTNESSVASSKSKSNNQQKLKQNYETERLLTTNELNKTTKTSQCL